MMGPIHTEALRRLGYVEVVALAEVDEAAARAKADAAGDPAGLRRLPGADRRPRRPGGAQLHPQRGPLRGVAGHPGRRQTRDLGEAPGPHRRRSPASWSSWRPGPGVVHAIHFNYRNYALVQQMRAMVKSGELGRLFLAHGAYLQDWLILETDYNWRVDSAEGGESRAVADIGSHWFDTVQFITGDPVVEVLGDLTTVHHTRKKPSRPSRPSPARPSARADYTDVPVATEDCATVLFRTRSGAPGSVVISQVSAGRKNRFGIELDFAARRSELEPGRAQHPLDRPPRGRQPEPDQGRLAHARRGPPLHPLPRRPPRRLRRGPPQPVRPASTPTSSRAPKARPPSPPSRTATTRSPSATPSSPATAPAPGPRWRTRGRPIRKGAVVPVPVPVPVCVPVPVPEANPSHRRRSPGAARSDPAKSRRQVHGSRRFRGRGRGRIRGRGRVRPSCHHRDAY